ncbi:hypothetical protein [Streptomyces sp. NPDC058644]|uniref:hypothetical protein n=1 Tax=unclassified Streptomyces TaxID=2593676 RepID=UPI00364F5F75
MHRTSEAQPPERALDSTGKETPHRLLPWTTDTGKPCHLLSDSPEGLLSRLADNLEEAITGVAEGVLRETTKTLKDPLASRAEMEYSAIRLAECLTDVLRVAESRLRRLPVVEESESDADGPETPDVDA